VHAHELLELQPKARVEGDVTYKAMEMHQGAIILGKLQPVQVLDATLPMLADESESAPLKLETSNG
jgi:cytoskeletal protein CcmA (bactofilin family)